MKLKIGLIIVTAFFIVFSYNTKYSDTKLKEKEIEIINEEINESDKKEEKEEINQLKVQRVLHEAKIMMHSLDFAKAMFHIGDNLSDKEIRSSEELYDIFIDLSVRNTFEEKLERQEFFEVLEFTKSFNSVNVFFPVFLSLESNLRASLIRSSESLNPVFHGGATITSFTPVREHELIDRVNLLYDNPSEFYEVLFSIEGYDLVAFIVKHDGGFSVYSIKEKEKGSTPFLTIKEWGELFKEEF